MSLEGEQLMTQATGQPKFPLFAESDSKFFLKVVDAQVEFVRNEKGEVTEMVLHQGGRPSKVCANRVHLRNEISRISTLTCEQISCGAEKKPGRPEGRPGWIKGST